MRVTPDSIERCGGKMLNDELTDIDKNKFSRLMRWYMEEHGADLKVMLFNMNGLITEAQHKVTVDEAVAEYRGTIEELNEELGKKKKEIKQLKKELEEQATRHSKEIARIESKCREEIQNKDVELAEVKRTAEFNLDKAHEEIKMLRGCKSNLETQVRMLQNDNSKLHDDITNAAYYIDQQDKKLSVKEVELKQAEDIADTYRHNYSDVEEAWSWFSDLSPDFQDGVSAALGGVNSKLSLVCGAAQENNLRALWDHVNFRFNSDELSDSDIDNAKNLFMFCVEAVNMSMRSPNLKLLEAEIGQNFNSMTMCKANISKQLGTVACQIIPGFMYISSNKVQKQAMVVLE